VLAELASRGLRGAAFDLPGLGFADRPARFDYSWSGLGPFAAATVDALGLERFHLVVHDIGGPGRVRARGGAPQRIASLTLLNMMLAVEGFKRPWMTEPFARGGSASWGWPRCPGPCSAG
jgi:pimeloyl-ACP methyl ester carboxylesterase